MKIRTVTTIRQRGVSAGTIRSAVERAAKRIPEGAREVNVAIGAKRTYSGPSQGDFVNVKVTTVIEEF